MLLVVVQLLIVINWILLVANPNKGVCMYLGCFFLIPSLELPFLGLDATETSIVFAFFFTLANSKNINKIKKIDYSPIIPFIVLYALLFSLSFFSSRLVPSGFFVKYFIRYIILTFYIPMCIYTLVCSRPNLLNRINKTMVFVITIVTLYGLFLTLTSGANPYVDLLKSEMHLMEARSGNPEGRLFGIISSVFLHQMSFGVFLGFSFCLLLYERKRLKITSFTFWLLISLVLLCTIVCGVRSSLAALMGTGAVYLLLKRKAKLLLMTAILVGIVMVLISHIPALDSYIGSMFKIDSDDVSGSSITQRLAQLEASVFEIRENLLFGNGYAWHSYYLFMNDYAHPLLHGWESLLFVTITDSGFVGVLVWLIFIVYFYFKNRHDIAIVCLFSFFILYSLATGSFGEEMFYVFYVIFLCTRNLENMERKTITEKKYKNYDITCNAYV